MAKQQFLSLTGMILDMTLFFRAEQEGNQVNIYDGRGVNTPIHVLKIHTKPVTCIRVGFYLYTVQLNVIQKQ